MGESTMLPQCECATVWPDQGHPPECPAQDAYTKALARAETAEAERGVLRQRVQQAEKAARVTIDECRRQGVSLGRGLANYAATMAHEQLTALAAERDALAKDAARYRWLRDTLHGAKAGGGVEVNNALQVYEKPTPGEEVRIYWYQDTAVGFYEIHGVTLDDAIDQALPSPEANHER